MPLQILGIFNSCEKDLEQKLNFSDNLKPVNDVLMIRRSREAIPFRKNTHFQDISSIQTTLHMHDESIQQVFNWQLV